MIVWKEQHVREVAIADEIIFKRRDCQWILPQSLAAHLRYNPRHLPMVPVSGATAVHGLATPDRS